MPDGLDIDRKAHLSGTMSAHRQHLVVSSGRSDWTSRIENERDTAAWGKFTADVKSMLGRGGEFFDPYHNDVMVSTSSFTPLEEAAERESHLHKASGTPTASDVQQAPPQQTVDALLFPAFKHFKGLGTGTDGDDRSGNDARTLIKASLLPEKDRLNAVYRDLSDAERTARSRDPALLASSLDASSIQVPTILICSHGQRDRRCGVLGPLLHGEFTRYISSSRGRAARCGGGTTGPLEPVTGAFRSSMSDTPGSADDEILPVNVGMISHVGGHKWAGNVIIYVPPGMRSPAPGAAAAAGPHPLAGKGIWYGRVEPRHVEGIVEQTLARGTVIQELFRGGLSANGEMLRLPL
ncbi:hypothetical protein PV08_02469 [Exophiala spinifera]|uniref:Altered inheritance of mitochondria protein 32 n=1 Tax=Exophiala spinifera TaxID=91928 RepID=A0A0D1YSF3_9EURO|nr:uncharacterized protein PV08_02469 [Exophiala spinifera]KIW18181.1 hypothetical protein PV08_02469 [Exophiala spinifera]